MAASSLLGGTLRTLPPLVRSAAHEQLGLEVHGLLVGRQVTPPMQALCTHLHQFKSWSAVDPGGAA